MDWWTRGGELMAGTKKPTRHTASLGGEENRDGPSRQSQQPMSGKKRSPRGEPVLEHRSALQSRPPSHDHGAARGMVRRSLQAKLGRQVRDVYADIATEPVPERLVRLLGGEEKRR